MHSILVPYYTIHTVHATMISILWPRFRYNDRLTRAEHKVKQELRGENEMKTNRRHAWAYTHICISGSYKQNKKKWNKNNVQDILRSHGFIHFFISSHHSSRSLPSSICLIFHRDAEMHTFQDFSSVSISIFCPTFFDALLVKYYIYVYGILYTIRVFSVQHSMNAVS